MSALIWIGLAVTFGVPRAMSILAAEGPNVITPDSFISLGMVASVIGATAFIVHKLGKIQHGITLAQNASRAANQRTIGLLRVMRGLINGLTLEKADKDELHREIDSLLVPQVSRKDDDENGE